VRGEGRARGERKEDRRRKEKKGPTSEKENETRGDRSNRLIHTLHRYVCTGYRISYLTYPRSPLCMNATVMYSCIGNSATSALKD